MNKTYLLLGSNVGNSKAHIAKAVSLVQKHIGKPYRKSSLYCTAAWGNTQQPDFLNMVIIVETRLTAELLMQRILEIEAEMGRKRTVKNAPRIIDIDILFFNKEIIDQNWLQVPHPQIQNRRFVLIPLNQLSPNLLHPVLGKTVHQLLLHCADRLDVKKF